MAKLKSVKKKIKGKAKQMEGEMNQLRGKGVKGGMQKIQGKIEETIADFELENDDDHGDDFFDSADEY